MRWSEFSNKEIIDLHNGERLGLMGNTDLVVHPVTGQIDTIVLPPKTFFGFKTARRELNIFWREVRKIGPDMVIVERLPKGAREEL
jgi:YlmC/YmxH family sporulation protein